LGGENFSDFMARYEGRHPRRRRHRAFRPPPSTYKDGYVTEAYVIEQAYSRVEAGVAFGNQRQPKDTKNHPLARGTPPPTLTSTPEALDRRTIEFRP
jgi:hypothetical protein